jgi:hypothetical protein
VCGLTGLNVPSMVGDEHCHGIAGGSAIFRRAVPASPLALKGDRDDPVADDDAVLARARVKSRPRPRYRPLNDTTRK